MRSKEFLTYVFFDSFSYNATIVFYYLWVCRNRTPDFQEMLFLTMTSGGVAHVITYYLDRIISFCQKLVSEGISCVKYSDAEWKEVTDDTDNIYENKIEMPDFIKVHFFVMLLGLLIPFI